MRMVETNSELTEVAMDRWAGEVSKVIKDLSTGRGSFPNYYLTQAEEAAAKIVTNLKALRKSMESRDAELTQRFSDLLDMRSDPLVLVRDYGNVYSYHSAEHPCGWIERCHRIERILWGEAKKRNLHPCTSCGYYADAEAKRGRRTRHNEKKAS